MIVTSGLAIGKSKLVEVKVGSVTERQFFFGDAENLLNGKIFIGLSFPTAAIGVTPDNRTIVPDAIVKKTYLTLRDVEDKAYINRLPIESFFNTTGQNLLQFDNLKLDIRKCFIELFDPTGLTTSMSFLVNIFYKDK